MSIITTNYNMIIIHIAECIKHGKGAAISLLREEMSNEDIIRDTYIHSLVADTEAAYQVRGYYDNWTGPEEEARMRIHDEIFSRVIASMKQENEEKKKSEQ